MNELAMATKPLSADYNFDIFVATPMSAYVDQESYSRNRDNIVKLYQEFRRKNEFIRFFCPALGLSDVNRFDPNENALIQDLLALESSEAFIFYYMPPVPEKPSSVFVEAGMALTLRLPSVYLVRSRSDLPYMLREADKVTQSDLALGRRKHGRPIPLNTKNISIEPFVKIIETDAITLETIQLASNFIAESLLKRRASR